MNNRPKIMVNADDFGLNAHCSRAIALAFERGLLTDTTMTANGEFFSGALELAKKGGFLDKIGIHLNLTEGEPLTADIKKYPSLCQNGRLARKLSFGNPLSKAELAAVYAELTAQVKRLRDAGVEITHADSHHHVHTDAFIAPVAERVCRENGIKKIRLYRNRGGISGADLVFNEEQNKRLKESGFATAAYFCALRGAENEEIFDNTEIMVHPDFDKNGVLIDKRGRENGVPVGAKLPDLAAERGVVLKGYNEL